MVDRDAAMAVLAEEGWRLLLDAGTALESAAGDMLRAATDLARRRADAPGPRRAAALELVAEGARLAASLGLDERLLAVRECVEQATSGRVATWHALQIPAGAKVLEIGCGCGGDSLALAHRAANLIAVDTDPVRAACAHMNLMALGLSNARAIPGDGLDLLETEASRADVVFVDATRGAGGRRQLDPEKWSPPLSRLVELSRGARAVRVKAPPSLDAVAVAGAFRVTYVSSGGECVEAFLESPHRDVSGGAAVADVRAVLLPRDGPSEELAGARGQAPSGPLAAALYVPDPAAVRAGLLDELCRRHGLALVDPTLALLTGDAGVASPWLREHRVLQALPLHPSRVLATLRTLDPSDVRIHARGVATTGPQLERVWRRALRPGARGPALDVFATRVDGSPTAILASPPVLHGERR